METLGECPQGDAGLLLEVQEVHALQGSLDGQVGTLIKALTLLDCLWTELEVAGAWLWIQWEQPPEADLSDVRPPEGFEAG